MTSADSREETIFRQRLSEKCRRAVESYSPCFTEFVDGRNKRVALEVFAGYSADIFSVCYGGFGGAERVQIGVFPKDVYGYVDDENELLEMFDICALEIRGSGFSSFGHRDVMGSVLGLGIKRDVLGDVYLPDDKSAYLCLTSVAADYVAQSLEFVARDKVKVRRIPISELPEIKRQYSVISGTVASDRLDCIVALCTGQSREKSKQIINSGFVSVNHFDLLKTDAEVLEDDVISIRGYGRFVLKEHGTLTKKGRLRTIVHKMI